jgi:hypothetical protein
MTRPCVAGALGELDAARPGRCGRNAAGKSPPAKGAYIDCGERDQFNLLYGARRFVRRLNELGIAHRYDLNRTLTTDPGRFNVPRARLAPAMISTPGHWASRRRQRGALPAWSLRIVIEQGVFLLDPGVLLTCALRISLVAQTSYRQRFLGG